MPPAIGAMSWLTSASRIGNCPVMNELFVNIKADRADRPGIDDVYGNARIPGPANGSH